MEGPPSVGLAPLSSARLPQQTWEETSPRCLAEGGKRSHCAICRNTVLSRVGAREKRVRRSVTAAVLPGPPGPREERTHPSRPLPCEEGWGGRGNTRETPGKLSLEALALLEQPESRTMGRLPPQPHHRATDVPSPAACPPTKNTARPPKGKSTIRRRSMTWQGCGKTRQAEFEITVITVPWISGHHAETDGQHKQRREARERAKEERWGEGRAAPTDPPRAPS